MSAAVPTGWVPDSRSPRGAGAEGQVVSVPVPLGVVSPGGGGWLAFSPASTCSRGSAWLPRVHPPRDARANLTLPLNWVKGGKGPQSPERISLLKHLEGNEQVPPGPLGVEQGAWRSRAAASLLRPSAASRVSPGQRIAHPLALAQVLAALLFFWLEGGLRTGGGNSCLQLWGSPAVTRTLEALLGL